MTMQSIPEAIALLQGKGNCELEARLGCIVRACFKIQTIQASKSKFKYYKEIVMSSTSEPLNFPTGDPFIRKKKKEKEKTRLWVYKYIIKMYIM